MRNISVKDFLNLDQWFRRRMMLFKEFLSRAGMEEFVQFW